MLLLLERPALADTRLALIVGNSDYVEWNKLANPANDAALIASRLQEARFTVRLIKDAGRESFLEALDDFARGIARAKTSDSNVTALFYYAGHGVSYANQSYLVPTDARVIDPASIPDRMINADNLYDQIGLAGARNVLVFLDACRSPGRGLRSGGRGSASGGLSMPTTDAKAPTFFIAYSTSLNTEALDGINSKNSPFAEALASNITKPGISINDMMTNVVGEVLRTTNNQQRPWNNGSMSAPFYMVPGKREVALATEEQIRSMKEQDTAYQKIKSSHVITDFDGYLKAWPSGAYSELVRELRRRAIDEQSPKASAPPQQLALAGGPSGASRGLETSREELGVRLLYIPPTPPFSANLFRNDLLREVNGQPAHEIPDVYVFIIDALNRDGKVTLLVQRGQSLQMVTMRLR